MEEFKNNFEVDSVNKTITFANKTFTEFSWIRSASGSTRFMDMKQSGTKAAGLANRRFQYYE